MARVRASALARDGSVPTEFNLRHRTIVRGCRDEDRPASTVAFITVKGDSNGSRKIIGIDLAPPTRPLPLWRAKRPGDSNQEGKRLTPSVGAYRQGRSSLAARRQAVTNPKRTIYSISGSRAAAQRGSVRGENSVPMKSWAGPMTTPRHAATIRRRSRRDRPQAPRKLRRLSGRQ